MLQVTIDDIGDKQTFAKLREFSRQEHTEECFDFLAKVHEYRQAPTRDLTAEIINTFIRVCPLIVIHLAQQITCYKGSSVEKRAIFLVTVD